MISTIFWAAFPSPKGFIEFKSDRIHRISWIFFFITFVRKVMKRNPPAAEDYYFILGQDSQDLTDFC